MFSSDSMASLERLGKSTLVVPRLGMFVPLVPCHALGIQGFMGLWSYVRFETTSYGHTSRLLVLTMGGNRNVCKFCERTVAKSAHALRCSHCKVWVHVGCEELVEGDFVFMKNRSKHGFCWFCDACQGGLDARVAERVMSSVSRYFDALRGEVWFMEIVFVGECEVFVCL